MTKDKKGRKKVHRKVIHGTTPEERFQEIHGMTIEEWTEQQFKAKTGMTPDEWYIKQVKTTTPFNFIKERYGTVSEDDIELVKDLQLLGLKDGVINVLLDYVEIFSRIGMVHPLVREMGKNWHKENILTVEKAIVFVREEHKKYKELSEK
ncbi:DnaD domain protein [Sporosarcina luteola]|uniref:DnaD domain protein n=1 Tax=Sporosarcina luteola TaxID=582850 RepID=UPI00203B9FA7|nr:DnaD domain protein [Sporosarcina luteola]MCM3711828.1 DnaD domain protein [Sporosarcina luteola]